MEITYAELSSPGPVRPNNEDYIGFWQPDALEEKRSRGAIVVLADGVGGQGQGEVASRLAVETAIQVFREAKDSSSANQLVTQAFQAANVAVYDKSTENHGTSRMATTLAIAVLRNDQISVGNVGDSRVYLVRKGEIKQITTDHSYVAMQRKFGLITDEEARTSEQRSILTRSVGQDPTIRVDTDEMPVLKGDRIVLCCDGLHTCVRDGEICDIVGRFAPAAACRQLVALAEQRGAEDNVSVQVINIDAVEEVGFYRGSPVYLKPAEPVSGRDVQPGQWLDERFLIHEVISRSGMATIYKAMDRHTKESVAVKVPFMQFESDPGFFSRFQREEEIGLQLNHRYLLKFIPVEKKSRPYIVTEYLRGYTLGHLLSSVRPLPVGDALKFGLRICEALQHMHEHNIIHRDLKPQNIMVCYDGTIRLMDFGIARSEGRRITFTGFTPALGTPDYMAPEQVKGKRGDARTDIYSLGAMLYEMLTGCAPFEGENPLVIMNARLVGDPVAPRKQNPNLSPQIEEIILHAMEREPSARYASVAELKSDLEAPEMVPVTGRAERLEAPKQWNTRWRMFRLPILAAVVPILVALLFLLFLLLRHGGR